MNPFKIKKEDDEGMRISKAIMVFGIILVGAVALLEIGFLIHQIFFG